MRRWLRHHRYALRVALRRLAVQPFSSLTNLMVIGLALCLPLLGASALLSLQPVVRSIPVSPEITLFLNAEIQPEQARKLAVTLAESHGEALHEVRLVTRDAALSELRSNPVWADALSVLPDNPLPHALVAVLQDPGVGSELAERAVALAAEWRQLPEVDSVQLDREWVRRLAALLEFLRTSLAMLAVGVALVVAATVFNTVRLQALNQREEISVARLVGATEGFVRRPFLYLGALTGAVGGLLAIALSSLALQPLNAALLQLSSSYGAQFTLRLPDLFNLLLAIVFAAILGALAARWSVSRHTRL